MFKFIEVIGVSKDGFSEAVRDTIQEMINESYDVHFFNVIEQRGSVRDKKIEYQVVIKVAIKEKNKNNPLVRSTKNEASDTVCEWCGTALFKAGEYDLNKHQKTIICNSCGRICNIDNTTNSKFKIKN